MAALLNKYVWYTAGVIVILFASGFIGYKLKKDKVCDNTEYNGKQINQVIDVTNQGAKEIADIGLKAVDTVVQINKQADDRKKEINKKSESNKKILADSTEKDPNILGREAAATLGLEYIDDK